MKNALDKVFSWLLTSSTDPNSVSLTIKGIAIGVVPAAMTLFGFAHVAIGIGIPGSDQVVALINSGVGIFQALLVVFGACVTFYGIARKIWLTIFSSSPAA